MRLREMGATARVRGLAGLSHTDLVTAMTGEASPGAAAAGRTGMPAGEPVLAVTGLSYADRYADVGFEVAAAQGNGAIVTITSGREQE